VLIGNSFAALFAAEAIRRLDREGLITFIAEEPEHTYSRALLHETLAGWAPDRVIWLRERDYYDRISARPMLGRRVVEVRPRERRVVLADGESVSYDKLLISTGGAPFIPPGIDSIDRFEKVFTFTRLSDVRAIDAALEGVREVAILGQGLIGLQCAEGIAARGRKVTVVEIADDLLPFALDSNAAAIVRRELAREKIELVNRDTFAAVEGAGGKISSVLLKSGGRIPCQMVVIAVGVRPLVGLVEGSGIEVDRGIVVNERMETNVEGVYAAGDCAQGLELLSGRKLPLAVIPVASTMGMYAGYNMAGGRRTYPGSIPLNALQFGGIPIISYGYVRDEEGAEVFCHIDEKQNVYKKAIIKEGKLRAAVLVKDIERAGMFRRLIEQQVDVSDCKEELMKPGFNFAFLQKDYRDRLFTQPQ